MLNSTKATNESKFCPIGGFLESTEVVNLYSPDKNQSALQQEHEINSPKCRYLIESCKFLLPTQLGQVIIFDGRVKCH